MIKFPLANESLVQHNGRVTVWIKNSKLLKLNIKNNVSANGISPVQYVSRWARVIHLLRTVWGSRWNFSEWVFRKNYNQFTFKNSLYYFRPGKTMSTYFAKNCFLIRSLKTEVPYKTLLYAKIYIRVISIGPFNPSW